MKHIVIKAILLIPQANAFAAEIVNGVANVYKMFEKLAGDVFIDRIFARQLQRDRQHIQAIHPHPTRAIRLFEVASSWQRRATVKNSNIVQSQEIRLERRWPSASLRLTHQVKFSSSL